MQYRYTEKPVYAILKPVFTLKTSILSVLKLTLYLIHVYFSLNFLEPFKFMSQNRLNYILL